MKDGLLDEAREHFRRGRAREALWALVAWGDQKLDDRTSDLDDPRARGAGRDLMGALAEVAYLLQHPGADTHRGDGADAVTYLIDTYGDDRRIPVRKG